MQLVKHIKESFFTSNAGPLVDTLQIISTQFWQLGEYGVCVAEVPLHAVIFIHLLPFLLLVLFFHLIFFYLLHLRLIQVPQLVFQAAAHFIF